MIAYFGTLQGLKSYARENDLSLRDIIFATVIPQKLLGRQGPIDVAIEAGYMDERSEEQAMQDAITMRHIEITNQTAKFRASKLDLAGGTK